jgi:hypothetical protein
MTVTIVVRKDGESQVYTGRCVAYLLRRIAREHGGRFVSRPTLKWPPAAEKYLVQARKEKIPFEAIAAELRQRHKERYTKSACIGHYHRMETSIDD